jgi:hypothetical protein
MQLGRSISASIIMLSQSFISSELDMQTQSLLRSASEQVTKTALETTVFASLVTALAWPYALVSVIVTCNEFSENMMCFRSSSSLMG